MSPHTLRKKIQTILCMTALLLQQTVPVMTLLPQASAAYVAPYWNYSSYGNFNTTLPNTSTPTLTARCSNNELQVSVNTVSGATKYAFGYSTNRALTRAVNEIRKDYFVTWYGTTGTSFRLPDQQPQTSELRFSANTDHWIYAFAYNEGSNTSSSTAAEIRMPDSLNRMCDAPSPGGTPYNLSASSNSSSSVQLQWSLSSTSNTTGHQIELQENNVVKTTFEVGSSSTNANYSTAVSGASYRFRIRAINNPGGGMDPAYGSWSSYSAPVTVQAAIPTPYLTNFRLASKNTDAQLGWTNTLDISYSMSASNVDSSTIYEINTGNGFQPASGMSGFATLSGTGPSYTVSFRAKNGASGAYSQVVSANIKLDTGVPTLYGIPSITLNTTSSPIHQIGCSDPALSDGSTSGGCVTRQYLFSDYNSVTDCSTAPGTWQTAVTYPVMMEGSLNVCFRGYDSAGNVGYSAPGNILMDTQAPVVSNVRLLQNGQELYKPFASSYVTNTNDIVALFDIEDDNSDALGEGSITSCNVVSSGVEIVNSLSGCPVYNNDPKTRQVLIPGNIIQSNLNALTIQVTDASGKSHSVTASFFRDLEDPVIEVVGLTENDPNYSQSAKSDIRISCEDSGGCAANGLRYILEPTITQSCEALDTSPMWVTCSNNNDCAIPTITSVQQLCVSATDFAGRKAFSSVYTASVDTSAPTLSDVRVMSNGNAITARDNIYYINETSASIAFTPMDVGTGLASCAVDGEAVPCTSATEALVPLTSLPAGEQTIRISAVDRAGNPVARDLNLFVDTTAPTISGPFIARASEENRSMTLELPTSFEDANGSGVDYIFLSINQNGSDFTGLTPEMIEGANPLITVDPVLGTITIARDTTPGNPSFPATLTLINLPADFANSQATYDFTLEAFDKAGNNATATDTVNTTGLAFDTLAPSITEIRSTSNGQGTSASPYLVNNTQTLQLVVSVLEGNNSQPTRSSVPLRAILENANGVTQSGSDIVCNSLLNDNTCIGSSVLSIPANFSGSFNYRVQDAGGNLSEVRTVYVKQDSDAPTWTNDGRIEAISPNGAEILNPGTPFLSESFTFRAIGLINDDQETQTFANVRYTDSTGAEVTQKVAMQNVGANTYTFSVNASDLAYGTAILGFAMEDAFGNVQTGNDTKSYETFHDNRRPLINNFNYRFEDENAIIAWDGITEDSFPVRVTVESSEDGETWIPKANVNIGPFANANAAQNFSTTVSEVLPGSQLRLTFRDEVVGYKADNTGFEVVGTPQTQYLMRDMLLSVSVDREEEQLSIGYIPQSDVTNLTSYAVSYTGPTGAESFTTITDFSAGGASLGTIASPLIGQYVFTAVLNKSDGSTQTTRRNFTLTEDILTPRATISLTENANLRFEANDGANGTWYFNSDNPELTFTYDFAVQNGTVYEESLPVTITANGTTFAEPLVLNTLSGANNQGTYTVELIEDNIYTITVSATDNSAAKNQASRTFRVVKDRSNPEVRLTARAGGEEITLFGSAAGEEDVLQTASRTISFETAVDGELEPVTIETRLNGTLLETRTALSTMNEAPFTQGFTYSLELPENDVSELEVIVRDRTGGTTTETVQIRHDNQAPTVTGDVLFASASSNVNPVPLSANLSVTDFSQVYYTVVANGVPGTRQVFSGNAIALEEGAYTSLRIIFSDALNNQTAEYDPLSGDITEIYVDTEIPTFDMTAEPDTIRTNAENATLSLRNIADGGATVTVLISQNNRNVVTETLNATQFASGSGFTLPFDTNIENTFEVRIRDGANNVSEPQIYSIIHDNQGPEVTNIVGALNAEQSEINWTFEVRDQMASEITSVRVLLHDQTTGRVNATTMNLTDLPNFTFDASVIQSGHEYRILVVALDELGNESIVPSPTISIPQNPLDELDPRENGPEIDPDLVGDTITVTINNQHLGGNINYVAEDLPRGTHVILGEVLDNGVNTITNLPLTQLPVGEYIMTIEDHLGNIQTINPYIIAPYYTSPNGDLDGNGFGGGITDHKLLIIALARGDIYAGSPILTTRLSEIQAVIATNISTQIEAFLRN